MLHNKILIVEDDKDILEIISLYLENNNFKISKTSNGKEAIKILENKEIDLVIADIMMPVMDGYSLVKEIRKKSNIPIIVISAKSLEEDKIQGLEIGADAYITKPFKPLEVVASVKSIIRRCYKYGKNKNKIVAGNLEFDEKDYTIKQNGKILPLTLTETKILAKMMQAPGEIFTKEQLYECMSNQYLEIDANTIMVHISNIRLKLKNAQLHEECIKTIRGIGYKLEIDKK